jgi:alpha-1,3-glucan synthase
MAYSMVISKRLVFFFDWQRQLAKFASVQDRLREWVPSVREKIEHFSC